jgi:hypothetical protein
VLANNGIECPLFPALALALAALRLLPLPLPLQGSSWIYRMECGVCCCGVLMLVRDSSKDVQLVVMREHHHLSVTHDWAATSSRRCHVSAACSSLVLQVA